MREDRESAHDDSAIVRGVTHVDQEGPQEGLTQVVGQLVAKNEGEDLEGSRPAEEPEERFPHRLPQRTRRSDSALPLPATSR